MDVFLNELGEKIEEESIFLTKTLEPEHKKLISRSYKCMSNCFMMPDSIEACGKCAESCHVKVRKSQDEIQYHISKIQQVFQTHSKSVQTQ